MEEAREFAQKHFNVEKFNLGDDLEFANWVNEGLTNINNRYKGKAKMPQNLELLDNETLLKMLGSSKNTSLGTTGAFANGSGICFNKDFFDPDSLRKSFKQTADLIFSKGEDGKTLVSTTPLMSIKELKSLAKIWERLEADPSSVSRFDLQSCMFKFEDMLAYIQNPSLAFKAVLNDEKALAAAKNAGFELNPEKFAKLSKDEQLEFMSNLVQKSKIFLAGGTSRSNSPFDILYHEMGHVQHYENKSIMDFLFKDAKKAREFAGNLERQATAGKVSWYAQTAPDEFVAETFNAIMAGKKMPQDVLELYKFYNGPIIPGM